MSEPRTLAKSIRQVVPGIYRWRIADERIGGFESDAYAVIENAAIVLVDPLALASKAEASLARLGRVEATCLTGSCHQRAAWRYRRNLGVKVWAPRRARGLDEKPDATYDDGDTLPGGLTAVHTPGPTDAHFAFFRRSGAILFCPDLLSRAGPGRLRFISEEYHDEPTRTRESVRMLLGLPFRVACFSHAPPLVRGGRAAIREALRMDARR